MIWQNMLFVIFWFRINVVENMCKIFIKIKWDSDTLSIRVGHIIDSPPPHGFACYLTSQNVSHGGCVILLKNNKYHTHLWPFSKRKFNLKSDRVNLVARASPIECLLFLANVWAIQYKLGPERLTRLGN